MPTDIVIYYLKHIDDAPSPFIADTIMRRRASMVLVLSLEDLPIMKTEHVHFPLEGYREADIFCPEGAVGNVDPARTSKHFLQYHSMRWCTRENFQQLLGEMKARKEENMN